MGKLAFISIFMFSTLFANANSSINAQDPYYQISDVTVEVLSSSEDPNPSEEYIHIKNYVEPDPRTQVGDIISTIGDIIAFGKEIYKIVEAGKPVINTKYAPISALPLETEYGTSITPTHLSHWQAPKFVKFKVSYKNGFGVEVVAFTYNVNMSYGGQYRGKGAYITNAQIVPEKVSASWGFTFNAQMSLVGLTNVGSDESPIAGATIKLNYAVSTVLKEIRNNMTLFISGDGTIQQM